MITEFEFNFERSVKRLRADWQEIVECSDKGDYNEVIKIYEESPKYYLEQIIPVNEAQKELLDEIKDLQASIKWEGGFAKSRLTKEGKSTR